MANILLPQNISKNKKFQNIPKETDVTGTNYAVTIPSTSSSTEAKKQFALITSLVFTNKTERSIPIYARVTNDVDGETAFLLYGVNLPPGTAFEVIQGNKVILNENDKLFVYHSDSVNNVVDCIVSYVIHRPEAEYTV